MSDLEVPRIFKGGVSLDDRGYVKFNNDFDFNGIKRFYMVENHNEGFIRAWHGHIKESKYVCVISGAALIGAVSLSEKSSKPHKFTLDSSSLDILYIPKGYANGFMNLKNNTKVIFFSDSTIKETADDDIRFDYDKWNIWSKNYR